MKIRSKCLLFVALFIACLALLAVGIPTHAAEGTRVVIMSDGGKTDTILFTNLVDTASADVKKYAGIQIGTLTAAADGSKTNSFSTVYSAAPTVAVTLTGEDNSITNVLDSVTTSNFVWRTGKASQTGTYIAIGTP